MANNVGANEVGANKVGANNVGENNVGANNNINREIVILEPMYETDEGLEFIVNPNDEKAIEKQIESGNFRLAFHFQSVDCAAIYAIIKKPKWDIDMDFYQYLKINPYDKKTLLDLLVTGNFDIGISRIGSYHVIKEITPYDNPINNEIHLHYTEPMTNPENIAWRSINWDLFANN